MGTALEAKIGKLLRWAEGAGSDAEAEAFLDKAQQLATDYSIDLAMARAFVERSEKRSVPVSDTIVVGDVGTRGLRTYVELFGGIAQVNDIEFDVAQNSTRMYLFGFPEDIEVARLLYRSLVTQMVESSTRYLRSGEWAEARAQVWWSPRENAFIYDRPMSAVTGRINFQLAYAERIRERLAQAREDALARRRAGNETAATATCDEAEGTGMELVLVRKRKQVDDFYSANSEARGTYRGYRSQAGISDDAHLAGRSAADTARIGATKSLPGQRASLTS